MKIDFKKIKSNVFKLQKKVCDNVTRVVLFTEYFLIVMPTALLMKLFRRDRLKIRKPVTTSYWKTYNNTDVDYERQF